MNGALYKARWFRLLNLYLMATIFTVIGVNTICFFSTTHKRLPLLSLNFHVPYCTFGFTEFFQCMEIINWRPGLKIKALINVNTAFKKLTIYYLSDSVYYQFTLWTNFRNSMLCFYSNLILSAVYPSSFFRSKMWLCQGY